MKQNHHFQEFQPSANGKKNNVFIGTEFMGLENQ